MADPRIRRADPSVELAVLTAQTFLSATWTLVSATWTGISTTRAMSMASRRHINSNQEPHRAKKLHVQKRKSPSYSSGFFVRPGPARFGKISLHGVSVAAFGTSSAGRAGQTRPCSASSRPAQEVSPCAFQFTCSGKSPACTITIPTILTVPSPAPWACRRPQSAASAECFESKRTNGQR